MATLRHALRQRRLCQQEVQACRQDATAASGVLHEQYRKHVVLLLGSAAAGGALLGRHGGKLKPPKPLLRAAFSWSMLLIRGLL